MLKRKIENISINKRKKFSFKIKRKMKKKSDCLYK